MKFKNGTEVFILEAEGYSFRYIHTIGVIQASEHNANGHHVRLFDDRILFFYEREFILNTKINRILYGVDNG